jgi:hypothetical protein
MHLELVNSNYINLRIYAMLQINIKSHLVHMKENQNETKIIYILKPD